MSMGQYNIGTGPEQELFRELKSRLWSDGYGAIAGFIGQDVDPAWPEADIDGQMDDAWAQMPDEEYSVFLARYGLAQEDSTDNRDADGEKDIQKQLKDLHEEITALKTANRLLEKRVQALESAAKGRPAQRYQASGLDTIYR